MPEPGGGDAGRYSIGELAEEFGLTLRSIRHYEDEGLLAPERDGQQRVYGRRDRARLSLICRGKRLGFSLPEIKDFLNLYEARGVQSDQMRYLRRVARRRIEDLQARLADVQQTLSELHDIDEQISRYLGHPAEDSHP